MQGAGGRVRSQGRTVELFLGRFVCHLLKQLTDSPAGLQLPLHLLEPQCWARALAVSQGVFVLVLCGEGTWQGALLI